MKFLTCAGPSPTGAVWLKAVQAAELDALRFHDLRRGHVTDRPARGGNKYGRNRCGGGPSGYQSACQQSPANGTRCGWPLRSTQTVAGS